MELIWEYAIEDIPPRIIEIKKIKRPSLPWWSSAPIPALLHACSRSRFLAQKHYEPTFPYGPCHWRQPGQPRFTRLLFNYEKDVIYLSGVLDFIGLLEYVEEMYYEDRMRARKMAFGPPLQKQVEERLHMDESLNSARVLVDLLSKLEITESTLHGKSLTAAFVKERAW
jgi:hypothetical protein